MIEKEFATIALILLGVEAILGAFLAGVLLSITFRVVRSSMISFTAWDLAFSSP